jgi:hypothetical protein
MKPIVLIHEYSAESHDEDQALIEGIYGDLPQRLRETYDVIEIDLSRYVSLNDSVTIQDIARSHGTPAGSKVHRRGTWRVEGSQMICQDYQRSHF